jgi:hypothetical protein
MHRRTLAPDEDRLTCTWKPNPSSTSRRPDHVSRGIMSISQLATLISRLALLRRTRGGSREFCCCRLTGGQKIKRSSFSPSLVVAAIPSFSARSSSSISLNSPAGVNLVV